MTTVLPVQSSGGTYDVVIGSDVIEQAGQSLLASGITTDVRVFIITDENVQKLGYADQVRASCERAGFTVGTGVVRPGDGSKTLDTAAQLYEALLVAGVRRNGVVVAVGGGMAGDLGGFVAATYQRGIRFVQIPTTLLAHDSSIGGKVGVNLPLGKNLVGAFHPPVSVLYDTAPLSTLPDVEWQGGMAEVIKHGIIGDPALFTHLRDHPVKHCPDASVLESLLAQACSVKVRIVESDEHESGQRMLLNLGHTVGHAVELVSKYALNHGYAVAIGTSVEAELAVARGWMDAATRDSIRQTLHAHGLPIVPPDYPLSDIFEVLGHDKKHDNQGWTFALPQSIGRVEIARDVTPDEVRQAWDKTIREGQVR